MTNKQPPSKLESIVEKHYLRTVAFLIILILGGTGFWCLRSFHPTLFLGKPDFIAVPNKETPEQKSQLPVEVKPILLNINTASAQELQTLPSIGPQTAQKIIQYREEHGDFSSIDALTEVKGIGEKTLEKVKPFISVE